MLIGASSFHFSGKIALYMVKPFWFFIEFSLSSQRLSAIVAVYTYE